MYLTPFYLPAAPQRLYDGFEDGWINQLWPLPLPDGTNFPAQPVRDGQPLQEVAEQVGKEGFQQLLREVRAVVRDWSGQGDFSYKGYDGLPLYYVRHGALLWVLAAGEFQPARYKTFLHGGWQVS